MQLTVTFRHMEPSEAVKEHVEDKLGRLEKFFPDPMRAQIVLATERYRHQVDVTVTLSDGTTIKGKEVADDMYSAVDLVMDKLDRQIRRYKDKATTYRAQGGAETPAEAAPAADSGLKEPASRDETTGGPATA